MATLVQKKRWSSFLKLIIRYPSEFLENWIQRHMFSPILLHLLWKHPGVFTILARLLCSYVDWQLKYTHGQIAGTFQLKNEKKCGKITHHFLNFGSCHQATPVTLHETSAPVYKYFVPPLVSKQIQLSQVERVSSIHRRSIRPEQSNFLFSAIFGDLTCEF